MMLKSKRVATFYVAAEDAEIEVCVPCLGLAKTLPVLGEVRRGAHDGTCAVCGHWPDRAEKEGC